MLLFTDHVIYMAQMQFYLLPLLLSQYTYFRLRDGGFPVRFLTNTTKESKSFLHSRLRRCGFAIEKEEIFTSLTAARQFIEKNKHKYLNPILFMPVLY